MFNVMPASHTPTAIRDTAGLWFHIAILETKQDTMRASMANDCKPEYRR